MRSQVRHRNADPPFALTGFVSNASFSAKRAVFMLFINSLPSSHARGAGVRKHDSGSAWPKEQTNHLRDARAQSGVCAGGGEGRTRKERGEGKSPPSLSYSILTQCGLSDSHMLAQEGRWTSGGRGREGKSEMRRPFVMSRFAHVRPGYG